MEENRLLTEAAEAFEERLHHETRRAEKRRLSAANRAELEVSNRTQYTYRHEVLVVLVVLLVFFCAHVVFVLDFYPKKVYLVTFMPKKGTF